MGKKKLFGKNAQKFSLVHRHNDVNSDHIVTDSVEHEWVALPKSNSKTKVRKPHSSLKKPSRADEEMFGFYNYGKHMRPIGSGGVSVFIPALDSQTEFGLAAATRAQIGEPAVEDLDKEEVDVEMVEYLQTNELVEDILEEDVPEDVFFDLHHAECVGGDDLEDDFITLAMGEDDFEFSGDEKMEEEEEEEEEYLEGDDELREVWDEYNSEYDSEEAVMEEVDLDGAMDEFLKEFGDIGKQNNVNALLGAGNVKLENVEKLRKRQEKLEKLREQAVEYTLQAFEHLDIKEKKETDAEMLKSFGYEPKPVEQWDVKSVLSTYTNTENHPTLITRKPTGKVKLMKKFGMHLPAEFVQRMEPAVEAETDDTPVVNKGEARGDESPESKKERKRRVKEERRLKREAKKNTKLTFVGAKHAAQKSQASNEKKTSVYKY